MQKSKKPIIVFAGVFDPVHNGHVEAARAVLEKCGSSVVFLPERSPWHKHGSTPYEHRLAMVSKALAGEPHMTVLNYPMEKMRIKETFRWLANRFPGMRFVWMFGSDVAPFVGGWDDVGMLPELSVDRVIVVGRNNDTHVSDVGLPGGIAVDHIASPHPSYSSSRIRSGVIEAKSALHPEVERYCKEKNLYSFS